MSAPAAAPSAQPRTREERDVAVARKMFLGGLLFLPWIWAMCLMKYYKHLIDGRETHPHLRWCECSAQASGERGRTAFARLVQRVPVRPLRPFARLSPLAAPRSLAAPAPVKPSTSALHAEYGRPAPRPQPARPAQGQLDLHGRPAPRPAAEEDQLEIPAFLRRQSNT